MSYKTFEGFAYPQGIAPDLDPWFAQISAEVAALDTEISTLQAAEPVDNNNIAIIGVTPRPVSDTGAIVWLVDVDLQVGTDVESVNIQYDWDDTLGTNSEDYNLNITADSRHTLLVSDAITTLKLTDDATAFVLNITPYNATGGDGGGGTAGTARNRTILTLEEISETPFIGVGIADGVNTYVGDHFVVDSSLTLTQDAAGRPHLTVTPGGSHTHDMSDIITGVLAYDQGGTGVSTTAMGDLLYALEANSWNRLAVSVEDQVLTLVDVAGDLLPQWANSPSAPITAITASAGLAVENGTGPTANIKYAFNAATSDTPVGTDIALWADITTPAVLRYTLWEAFPAGIMDTSGITSVGTVTSGTWEGTDVGIAHGGTGSSLTDPAADRILFWDDGFDTIDWLTATAGIEINGTNLRIAAPLAEIYGGTAQSTYVQGDILYASNTDVLQRLPKGAANAFLKMDVAGGLPEWDATTVVENITVGTGLTVSGTTTRDIQLAFNALSPTTLATETYEFVVLDTTTHERALAATIPLSIFDTSDVTLDGPITITNLLTTAGGIKSTGEIELEGTTTTLLFDESDATANNKLWEIYVSAETFYLRTANDARSGWDPFLTVTRNGTPVLAVTMPSLVLSDTPLGVPSGGTGLSTVTSGSMLYASDTDVFFELPKGAANAFLKMDVAGGFPEWDATTVVENITVGTGLTVSGTTTRDIQLAFNQFAPSTLPTATYEFVVLDTTTHERALASVIELSIFDTSDVTLDGPITITNLLTTAGGLKSTGQIELEGTTTTIFFDETDASANNKYWEVYVSAETFYLRTANDARSGWDPFLTVTRSGTNVGTVTMPNLVLSDTPLDVPSGGTGLSTLTSGDILYASNTDVIQALPKGGSNAFLRMDVAGSFPRWDTVTIVEEVQVGQGLDIAGGTGPIATVSLSLDEVAAGTIISTSELIFMNTTTHNKQLASTVNVGVMDTSNITSVGTITTGVWEGTDIGLAHGGTGTSLSNPGADRILFWDYAAGPGSAAWLTVANGVEISGTTLQIDAPLDETYGGTGQTGYTSGDILYASNTDILAKLPKGAANAFLKMDVAGGFPEWDATTVVENITVGTGLDISGTTTRNITLSLDEFGAVTPSATSEFIFMNTTTHQKQLASSIPLSIFSPDEITWAGDQILPQPYSLIFPDTASGAGVLGGSSILFDKETSKTPNDRYLKRITWNDGGGNWTFRLGHYYNAGELYTHRDTGAANIHLAGDSTDGYIEFQVAPKSSAVDGEDDAVTWANEMKITQSQFQFGPGYNDFIITSAGVVTTGAWQGTAITEVYGGTGQTSYTSGDILYASNTNVLQKLPKGAANAFLKMDASAAFPEWDATSVVESITVGAGLDISGTTTRNITLDFQEVAEKSGSLTGTDRLVGSSLTTNFNETINVIPLSIFNNDAGWASGTVTSVNLTAGNLVDVSGGPVTTSGSITVNVDLSELTDMTAAMVNTDEFVVLDASAQRRKSAIEIGLSIFLNDAGFVTSSGVTSVTAGTGLDSSGGTTPNITLDLQEVAEKTGALVGTDRLAGSSLTTNFNETIQNIPLSIFSNDSGWTSNTGDITQVNITAGNGLTGNVNTTSGAHIQTINVVAGSGITVAAGSVSHADTSSVADETNTGSTVIQSLTFDTFGHVLTVVDKALTHDGFTDFVANEHINHSTLDVIAGAGMTGGGALTSDVTLNVIGTANRITVGVDAVDIASTYVGQTSITTLGTIGTGTWQGSVIAGTYLDAQLAYKDEANVFTTVQNIQRSAGGTSLALLAMDGGANAPDFDLKIGSDGSHNGTTSSIEVYGVGTGATNWRFYSSNWTNDFLFAHGSTGGLKHSITFTAIPSGTNDHGKIAIHHTSDATAGSWGGYDATGVYLVSGGTSDINGLTILSTGVVTAGTWQATDVGVAYGGTGRSTFASGAIVYASSANVINELVIGTSGYVLKSNGSLPYWAANTVPAHSQGASTITTGTFGTGDYTFNGSLIMSTNNDGMLTDSDTFNLKLSGGSAFANANGALIVLYGTSAAGSAGDLVLTSGNVANSQVLIKSKGTTKITVEPAQTTFSDSVQINDTLTTTGILSVDNTTDTSSGVTGSIHTDGGLGIAKKLYVAGATTLNDTLTVAGRTTHTPHNIGTQSTAQNVNALNGNVQQITLSGSLTLTFTNMQEGVPVLLLIRYDGAYTPTLSSVIWPDSTTPSWTSANTKADLVHVVYLAGSLIGSVSLNYAEPD